MVTAILRLPTGVSSLLCVAVCALLALPKTSLAADPWLIEGALRFEGMPIKAILLEPANQPLTRRDFLSRLPFTVGSRFEEHELRKAIQSLYSSGRYAQIAIDASTESGGVLLRFVTTSAYFVGHVEIAGVESPPNSGQLFGAAQLRLGTPFVPEETRSALEKMQRLLKENGFYNAAITTQVTNDSQQDQTSILFQIDAGKRARYKMPLFDGVPPGPQTDLLRATHWKRLYGLLGWHQVTAARMQTGLGNLRRYYQKRDLLQADVLLTDRKYDANSNTLQPVVHINPGPRVLVQVTGVHLSPGAIKQLVPIYDERAVDEDLLTEGAENLEQYFQLLGYFGAQASYETAHDASGRTTTVTYNVARGPRHRFVFLAITGNRYFPEETLRERMYITPAHFPRYPQGRFSENSLEADVRSIRQLYGANGFEDATVETHVEDDFQRVRGHLGVFLRIREGVQTLISSNTIEGVAAADMQAFTPLLVCAPGQPFSNESVSIDRENLLNFYYNQGYLNADFESFVTPDALPHHVQLRYVIRPGPRKYVRDVLVSGLQTTRRDLVLRRIQLRKGEPLSLSEQNESQRSLYNLGVFARVNTALQNPDGDENEKNVLFDIDEARHYSFNVGVGAQIARIGGGVTTLDNPAGTTGFAPRLTLGLTRENFLGLGESLGAQAAVSTIEQRGALTWFIPQFASNPNLNLTSVILFDNSNDIRTFTADRREASIQLGQKLSRAYTLQYRFIFRNVTLNNIKIDQLLVPLLSQPETVGLTEVSLIQDKRDDPTDAHHGVYTTVDLSYAPSFFGSRTSFARGLFRNSTYYLLHRDFVLARSTQFGLISRTGGVPSIPLAERLYSGGSTSIRAFPDFQAGPRDPVTGFPIGGNALFINNTELRFPLYGDNIGGVIFHDAGNVYSSLSDFSLRFRQANLQDFNYLVQNVGVGIRYRTPIGPIRADISISPDAPRFFGLKGTLQDYINNSATSTVQKINGFQFHISLGQAF